MKKFSLAALLLASCVTTDRIAAHSSGARHVWTNAQTGETIAIADGTAIIAGHSYPLRNCSTADRLCVASEGPINLTVYRACDDLPDGETRIWGMIHHTPILRDSRSPQVLYEYSYEEGVTAIYYAPGGLGITDLSGPNLSSIERHRFAISRGRRFMACR